MPKLLWVKSRYNAASFHDGYLKRLWDWFISLDRYLRFSLIILLLFAIATPAFVVGHFSLYQHAASSKTATITAIPSTGSYAVGQQFVVNVGIDGGGQPFNAAQAKLTVSSNLTIQSLSVVSPSSGGCNFTFINNQQTPTLSSPSFAGAILNGSSSSCVVYSMVVQANAAGIGTITITNGSVKSYVNSSEILASVQSGTYTIGSTLTPTTSAPTPTLVPTATPTPTPIVPSPTTQPLASPTFDAQPSATYNSSVTLTGTVASGLTLYINNSTTGITYPTTTTWQYSTTLSLGTNAFTAYTKDSSGNMSSSTTLTMSLHKLGDINGDGVIDLTDLSMFATDWGNTGILNYALSDMNGDGIIDLTDFSILAKAYGN